MDDEDTRRVRARERVRLDLNVAAAPLPTVVEASLPAGMPDGASPGRDTRTPGRLIDPDEAASLVRGFAPSPDAAARFGERLAQIAASGLVPETSDAQARAHLARRRAAGAGVVPPVRLAGPQQARLGAPAQARLGAPDAAGNLPVAAPPGGRLGRPEAPPANLPAALGQRGVAAPNPDWKPEVAEVAPRWWSVYDAPAYMVPVIRALGEQTFRSFPCFAAHRDAAQQAGEDPLGSVRLLASLNGAPNGDGEIEHVARWIQGNGVMIAAHQLAFPTIMAGYEPRVILAAHGDTSYLFVEELKERGAPMDARYVYAWKGGMDFYLGNRDALGAVRGIRGVEAGPVRVAGRGRRGVAAPVAALEPPAPVVVKSVNVAEERLRRARHVAALPVAAQAPVSNKLLEDLRELGFRKFGSPQGPVLRKATEDGAVVLMPEKAGVLMTESTSLRALRLDAEGETLAECLVSEASEVERLLEPVPGPTP